MERRKASVVWELTDDERLVVDVDAPLRPFGAVPTPPRGVPSVDAEEPVAESDEAVLRPGP